MTITWCIVPKIWSTTDRIFCHFGPYFALSPPNNPKIQNFEELKKTTGDIIILHKYTKNHDHMLYCSWDMVRNRCNYFSFLDIFLPFYPSNNPKNQNFKRMKKTLEISSFYNRAPKIMIICYTGPEIWCVTDVIIFHFGLFFALLPKNQHFRKMKKNTCWYHHFIQVYQTSLSYAILFLRYGVWQM